MRVIRAHPKAPKKHLLSERHGCVFLGAWRLIREEKVGGGREKKGRRLETLRWKDLSWSSASGRGGDGEGPSVPADTQDGSCGSRLIFIQLLRSTSGNVCTASRELCQEPAPLSADARQPLSLLPVIFLTPSRSPTFSLRRAPASESQRHIWRSN